MEVGASISSQQVIDLFTIFTILQATRLKEQRDLAILSLPTMTRLI